MTDWPQISIRLEKEHKMCFACGQDNPIGLKLRFDWDGKTARSEFTPSELHQGWSGIVHGGIISCLLDEAMSYATLFEGIDTVTARLEVRIRRPVKTGEPLSISGSITKRTRKLLETKAVIFASDGAPVAEATAKQFIVKTGQEKEKTKAVIWDMDGVIADTASYHFKAWHEVFQKRGIDFTEQDFRHHFGQRNDTIIRNALGGEIAAEEMDTIATEKERAFRKAARQNVKPLPGVIALIKALGKHGFKLAIASCAPDENIQLLTRDLGINSYFNAITSGREVSEGKPDPQCFLLAAGRLGIEPGSCVVIEDAIAGVTAARRAGMRCIAVTNTHPREKLKEADLTVDTLETVTASDFERLLSSPGVWLAKPAREIRLPEGK